MATYRFERKSGIQRHKQASSILLWFITHYKSIGLVSKKMRFFFKSAFLPQDILESMVRRSGLLNLRPKIQIFQHKRFCFQENNLVEQGEILGPVKYREIFLKRQIFDAPAGNSVLKDALRKIKNIKFSCIFSKIFVILNSIVNNVRDYIISNVVKHTLSGLLGEQKILKIIRIYF